MIYLYPRRLDKAVELECPACQFLVHLETDWMTFKSDDICWVGSEGYWAALWDHPLSRYCSHFRKYLVFSSMFIFADDWELTAEAMGVDLFSADCPDGLPESQILEQCQHVLYWRERSPGLYYNWLKRKRATK